MELRHLRYFAGVARCLNYSEASRQLNVAQPADQQRLSDEDYNKLFAGEELHCLTNLASSHDWLTYLL